jgi:hypothetical protein
MQDDKGNRSIVIKLKFAGKNSCLSGIFLSPWMLTLQFIHLHKKTIDRREKIMYTVGCYEYELP